MRTTPTTLDDPNFCVGCAITNAVQGLLWFNKVDATGDYGQRLYERAIRETHGEAHVDQVGGLKIHDGLEWVNTIFDGVCRSSEFSAITFAIGSRRGGQLLRG